MDDDRKTSGDVSGGSSEGAGASSGSTESDDALLVVAGVDCIVLTLLRGVAGE